MSVIDVMTSDINSRLLEAARIIGVTEEHKGLLIEAANTIASLREKVDDKEKQMTATYQTANKSINNLKDLNDSLKARLTQAEEDRDFNRQVAQYFLDNQ